MLHQVLQIGEPPFACQRAQHIPRGAIEAYYEYAFNKLTSGMTLTARFAFYGPS